MLTALKKGRKEWLGYHLVRVYFSCMHEALIDHHPTFFADHATLEEAQQADIRT